MNENNWISRWSNEQIQAMLLEQYNTFWQQPLGIPRLQLKTMEKFIPLPHSVIISGLRRVGKSTLLAQLAHKLGKDTFYYINFEDERFIGFTVEDTNDLYQALVELFGERKNFILDEIQNIPGWERFVRRFTDMGFKFYLSGSNASLLSRELGTRLTGRYLSIELFPFSFVEYLQFIREEIPAFSQVTTVERARINSHLFSYLKKGGIPDALKYPELGIPRSLYHDILYRDIAARYKLDAVTALKELSFFLISNPTGMVSFNKLKTRLQLGSVNTVSSYIEYLENSWLIFTLNRFAFSVKRQQVSPKKIYVIDAGFVNEVGFSFSANTGKLLENLVFITLRRQNPEIFYYVSDNGYEIDFYLPGKHQLIQVAQQIDYESTREREIRAIMDAAKEIDVRSAIILCDKNEPPKEYGQLNIQIKAVTDWLVQQDISL